MGSKNSRQSKIDIWKLQKHGGINIKYIKGCGFFYFYIDRRITVYSEFTSWKDRGEKKRPKRTDGTSSIISWGDLDFSSVLLLQMINVIVFDSPVLSHLCGLGYVRQTWSCETDWYFTSRWTVSLVPQSLKWHRIRHVDFVTPSSDQKGIRHSRR